MEWAEIDEVSKVWSIPAPKMKMRQPHTVPLSRQALTLLGELKEITGAGKYCLPSIRTPLRPKNEHATRELAAASVVTTTGRSNHL